MAIQLIVKEGFVSYLQKNEICCLATNGISETAQLIGYLIDINNES